MTHAEQEAARALRAVIAAIEFAQRECERAGCDGYIVVNGLEQAITEIRDVLIAVEGRV